MENKKSTRQQDLQHHHLKGYSKCMLAGGYAVVFEGHKSLVLKTEDYYEAFLTKEETLGNGTIRITSPQYTSKPCHIYHYKNELLFEADEQNKNTNPYIEAILKTVLLFFWTIDKEKLNKLFDKKSINIEIYSTGNYLGKNHQTGNIVNNFPEFEGEPQSSRKTGIGSSSSFIVSMCKALYFAIRSKLNIRIIHFLAQLANSIAQKKVGSGFDITCATYGSVIFERIMKFHFEYFLKLESINDPEFGKKIIEYCKNDENHLPVHVCTRHLAITLVEYSVGFDTRIAVKKVLDHYQEHLEDRTHFLQNSDYFTRQILNILMAPIVNTGESIPTNRAYRRMLKEAGVQSKVEIEPDFASFLIEYMLEYFQDDIVYAICPGAGGYDAIAVVSSVFKQEQLKPKIDHLLNVVLKQDINLASFVEKNQYLRSFKISIDSPDFEEKLNKLSVNVI